MKEQLIDKATYLTENEFKKFQFAITFAEQAHEGQFRISGEPYILHPFAVTDILLDCKADCVTLISALLHDVVEDTNYTLEDIQKHFGNEVSYIVDGLTKVDKKSVQNKEEFEAINFKKLLMAAQKDIRVIIIKVTDRLHNMRTLQVKNKHKQVPYANETIKIFAPLCHKLHLKTIQYELEDLAFFYLHNQKYKGMKQLLHNYNQILRHLTDTISTDMQSFHDELLTWHLDYEISPINTAYSRLQVIQDVTMVSKIHITTSSILDCYKILGMVHQLYEPIPHQFEDTISINSNLFNKCLKTKVKIDNHEIAIYIQTEDSKRIYDGGIFSILSSDMPHSQVQQLSEQFMDDTIMNNLELTKDALTFYDLVSYELFQDTIVVFTPQLQPIHLPEGATIIDFAFAVDTKLAIHMSSAKINGDKTSITTTLSHLDIVEMIIDSPTIHLEAKWLNFANTSKAQLAIHKAFHGE
ncbi:HD domain-containing protein [Bacillus sp. WLY-B-L8]|uniref:HD domain-containing protein n=1 Tax=Bacillus multifaciens TaxID=3068506 RepID=UPI0027405463|nr:HD domain-containing protein [Bacillus sp. WLY-B-L8]MDP7977723.1 HD domain-containing protein [Bacillus sp. WLY-B-L8]